MSGAPGRIQEPPTSVYVLGSKCYQMKQVHASIKWHSIAQIEIPPICTLLGFRLVAQKTGLNRSRRYIGI